MMLIVFVIYSVVFAIAIHKGLDLRKWRSWLYGLGGFLCGFAIGVLIGDEAGGVGFGIVFAFVIMYASAMMRWHRQRFK